MPKKMTKGLVFPQVNFLQFFGNLIEIILKRLETTIVCVIFELKMNLFGKGQSFKNYLALNYISLYQEIF